MKSILYIGNKLLKHGYSATSIETLGPLLESENYKLYYASSKKNKILRFAEMFFKTLLIGKKVDFVLIDTYSTTNFWYTFYVSQLCRIMAIPYIPILRGGNLAHRLNNSPKISRLIFSNSYRNIAPSGFLYEVFLNHNYPNLILIPNTISISKYFHELRMTVNPKFLWVRAFSKIYNPEMALKVFSKLRKVYPNAELCMVGPYKDLTKETVQELVKKNEVEVKLTGKLSKTEWIALSKNYDIFINTTHVDNTPVSVIEAMALGLPIVSTNVGGIPFLVKDRETALLVNDSDEDEMVNVITELIENPELAKKLSLNGRKLAEKFDWNVVKNQWKEILE